MTAPRCLPLFALLCCLCVDSSSWAESDSSLQEFRGETMATTYMVKIFGGPKVDQDLVIAVDIELRSVNDQMSTYLKSSEISTFNESTSTDWFAVSEETADVINFAQGLAAKTDGAFDVTVGPLVNAWSFGPDPKTNKVPGDEQLEQLRASVGYRNLEVRLDPPAIRKSEPELKIDLSAIAKGHAVDRVVDLLLEKGAENVFVEIGGEVRTVGDKGGQPWTVGIQMPDAKKDAVMIAHPMGASGAMATSGDYRNYFNADGQRYSHTIDPDSGKPVQHKLASVTVITDSCMAADAWATAINVLGPDEGLKVAQREKINALLVSRTPKGFVLSGSGSLAQYVMTMTGSMEGSTSSAAAATQPNAIPVMILAFGVFAVLICAMAVGVMFGRKPIAGSCGGLNNPPGEDGSVSCSMCSNPADACRELREKMEQGKQQSSAASS